MKTKTYEKEFERLQVELVKLQYHVRQKGLKIAVLFEGRDAAGKGGTIKRIAQTLNPRIVSVVALPKPTDEQKAEWYFQRYVQHLPSGGEIALFDRSWYNRAGVEPVMGFCTEAEHKEFLRSVPEFERMLKNSGLILIKYWLEIDEQVQEKRLLKRVEDPRKRWKLSPMDVQARLKWHEYTKVRDIMFEATDTPDSPWHIIDAVDKRKARLNCIRHFLSQIPYEDALPEVIDIPSVPETTYQSPADLRSKFVKDHYAALDE